MSNADFPEKVWPGHLPPVTFHCWQIFVSTTKEFSKCLMEWQFSAARFCTPGDERGQEAQWRDPQLTPSFARTQLFSALCFSSQELPPEPAVGLFSTPNPSPSVHLHRVCFAEHFTLGGFTSLWFFLTPLKWFSLFWDMPAPGLTQAVCLYQLGLSKRQEHSIPTIKELLSSITSICNNSEGFSLFNKQRIAQIKQEKHQLLTQPQEGTALVYKHPKSRLSFSSKASGWKWIFHSPTKSMTWVSPQVTTPGNWHSTWGQFDLTDEHKLHKAESPGSTS